MNIRLYTGSSDFTDYHSLTPTADRPKSTAGKEAGDYDKVILNKPQYPADESSFARILAREAAGRMENHVGNERVLKLQQQVEAGTYQPDAQRIAEHMLGYR